MGDIIAQLHFTVQITSTVSLQRADLPPAALRYRRRAAPQRGPGARGAAPAGRGPEPPGPHLGGRAHVPGGLPRVPGHEPAGQHQLRPQVSTL